MANPVSVAGAGKSGVKAHWGIGEVKSSLALTLPTSLERMDKLSLEAIRRLVNLHHSLLVLGSEQGLKGERDGLYLPWPYWNFFSRPWMPSGMWVKPSSLHIGNSGDIIL